MTHYDNLGTTSSHETLASKFASCTLQRIKQQEAEQELCIPLKFSITDHCN